MTEYEFPPLEDWQKVLFRSYADNPKGRWIVTKSKRQVGKSACLKLLLLYASLKNEGAYSLFISPVISQSRKVYKELCKMCKDIDIQKNSTLLTIVFPNGAEIEFCSAEQGDAIRGRTVKKGGVLCIDEAAYIQDEFFYEVLLATTNVYDADILITSTPRFKQGFFFELFSKGRLGENAKIISIDWNDFDTSKYLAPETLELYRRQMPARAFRSEYLAEFLDGDSIVFGSYKGCFGRPMEDTDTEVLLTIDWGTGTGEDDTAITQTQLIDGKMHTQHIWHFNDKGTNDTIEYIISLVKHLVGQGFKDIRIIVEKNSIGQVYFSSLMDAVERYETMYNDSVGYNREIEVTLSTFITTNSSKKTAIERLSTIFENGKAVLCDCAKLDNELSIYTCKVEKSGLVTYNAPSGFHDDLVMSLAFAANYHFKDICG